MGTTTGADVDDVKNVIKRWANAFGRNDAEAILDLWDEGYSPLMYQAEEFPDPLRGYEELKHYMTAMMDTAENIRGQALADLEADVMGDVAWCYIRGSITFDIPGLDQPIDGEARQTFVLRRTDGGWKIVHYHESRETPGLRDPLSSVHPDPHRMVEPKPAAYV